MSVTLPLKYHGGKQPIAAWILSHRPKDYLTYCETHFGGGSVLFLHDPEGKSEVVNDIDDELMNFWSVLRSPDWFEEFVRCLSMTPFSQAMFRGVIEDTVWHNIANGCIDKAVRFFIQYRQSRQGLGKEFATRSKSRTRRKMNEQVSAWLGAIEGLPEAHQRLQRVFLDNNNALAVILKTDSPLTWFYIDPTYLPTTRISPLAYRHEMSYDDHVSLLGTLSKIQGKFSLSSYHSALYDGVAADLGWRLEEKQVKLHSSSQSTKPTKIECLWMNY